LKVLGQVANVEVLSVLRNWKTSFSLFWKNARLFWHYWSWWWW